MSLQKGDIAKYKVDLKKYFDWWFEGYKGDIDIGQIKSELIANGFSDDGKFNLLKIYTSAAYPGYVNNDLAYDEKSKKVMDSLGKYQYNSDNEKTDILCCENEVAIMDNEIITVESDYFFVEHKIYY